MYVDLMSLSLCVYVLIYFGSWFLSLLLFVIFFYCFFFFKQKTAYEMRISDWSSDVCSSDLSSHALFLIDVRKPEMVSGLRAEGVFIMTNIVILTGRIARDPETRETKSGTSVTGITVVTEDRKSTRLNSSH